MVTQRHCTQCGGTVAEGAKFCIACGSAIKSSSGEPMTDTESSNEEPEKSASPSVEEITRDIVIAIINRSAEYDPKVVGVGNTRDAVRALVEAYRRVHEVVSETRGNG